MNDLITRKCYTCDVEVVYSEKDYSYLLFWAEHFGHKVERMPGVINIQSIFFYSEKLKRWTCYEEIICEILGIRWIGI